MKIQTVTKIDQKMVKMKEMVLADGIKDGIFEG